MRGGCYGFCHDFVGSDFAGFCRECSSGGVVGFKWWFVWGFGFVDSGDRGVEREREREREGRRGRETKLEESEIFYYCKYIYIYIYIFPPSLCFFLIYFILRNSKI